MILSERELLFKPRILKIRVINSAFSNSFLGKITTFHLGNPTSQPVFEYIVFILVVTSF